MKNSNKYTINNLDLEHCIGNYRIFKFYYHSLKKIKTVGFHGI